MAVDTRPTLVVRPMGAADLDAVTDVERGAYSRPPWTRDTFASELVRPDRCYLVGEVDGELVGFAGALVAAGEAQILTVAVAPAHRRRGAGRELVAALLAAVRGRGAGAVTLEVRAGNHAARKLYRRLGFVPVGERPGYYQDGEDALIMHMAAAQGGT